MKIFKCDICEDIYETSISPMPDGDSIREKIARVTALSFSKHGFDVCPRCKRRLYKFIMGGCGVYNEVEIVGIDGKYGEEDGAEASSDCEEGSRTIDQDGDEGSEEEHTYGGESMFSRLPTYREWFDRDPSKSREGYD